MIANKLKGVVLLL